MDTETLFVAQFEEFMARVRSHGRLRDHAGGGQVALRTPAKRSGASGSSQRMVAWGGAGAASAEASLVVPSKALATIPHEEDIINLVKTAVPVRPKQN